MTPLAYCTLWQRFLNTFAAHSGNKSSENRWQIPPINICHRVYHAFCGTAIIGASTL
jgi:hypothetical protein